MMVSYEHQFLFVHVPKTGGSNMSRALRPYAVDPLHAWENRLLNRIAIHVNHISPYRRKRFRGHQQARVAWKNLPKNVWNELFKFGFVRNPWSSMVSRYHFYGTNRTYRHQARIAAMSFPEFVEAWLPRSKQYTMLCDRNKNVLVDFVGRYECINEDFRDITHRIGIHCDLAPVDPTSRRDYRTYYDDRLIELVAEHLSDDIELFGYDFENGMAKDFEPIAAKNHGDVNSQAA